MSKKVSGWPLIAPKKIPEELPDIAAADAGKVLTVNDEGTAADWEAVPSELPEIEESDAGKVLTAFYGSGLEGEEAEGGVMWGRVDRLPAISSGDAGKVLTVNSGETGTEWAEVDALPAISSGDAGKVLTVNAGETGAEWAAAGVAFTKVGKNNTETHGPGLEEHKITFSATLLSNHRGKKVAFVELSTQNNQNANHYGIVATLCLTPNQASSTSYYPNQTTIPSSGSYDVYYMSCNPSENNINACVTANLFLTD